MEAAWSVGDELVAGPALEREEGLLEVGLDLALSIFLRSAMGWRPKCGPLQLNTSSPASNSLISGILIYL